MQFQVLAFRRRAKRAWPRTPEDFAGLLAHLGALVRTYEVTLTAYTPLSNHVHPWLQL